MDPPTTTRRSGPQGYSWLIDECKKQPGRWAFVRSYTYHNGQQVKAFRRQGCEAIIYNNGATYDLYVRWPEGEREYRRPPGLYRP